MGLDMVGGAEVPEVEPIARDRETIDRICGVPRHLAEWATPDTPKDGWRMGKGCALSPEKAEELIVALAGARAEEKERCAKISDGQAAKADDDGEPAAAAACRITSRKIRRGE